MKFGGSCFKKQVDLLDFLDFLDLCCWVSADLQSRLEWILFVFPGFSYTLLLFGVHLTIKFRLWTEKKVWFTGHNNNYLTSLDWFRWLFCYLLIEFISVGRPKCVCVQLSVVYTLSVLLWQVYNYSVLQTTTRNIQHMIFKPFSHICHCHLCSILPSGGNFWQTPH